MSKTILLNHSNWHFTKENTGIPTAIMGEAITLPHTWNAVDGQDGGNDYYRGTCWYTLALAKPTIPAGGKAVLQLDGAAMTAAVYLNGEKLAQHKGGYSTFRVDLTDHLKEENLLAISVDNRDNGTVYPQKADFTFYGGIYRDVYLDIKNKDHIEDIFIRTDIGQMDDQNAELISEVTVQRTQEGLFLKQSLKNKKTGEYQPLGESEISGTSMQLSYPVENVILWELEHPELYEVKTELICDGKLMDERIDRIGFRRAEFKKDGFYLNGKKIKLRGLNRHQSYPYVGYAMPKSMQQLDADILKRELGVNAVRTSHYPQSHYFIERCDEIGLLVFTEIPGWQHIGDAAWKDQAVENVRDMVKHSTGITRRSSSGPCALMNRRMMMHFTEGRMRQHMSSMIRDRQVVCVQTEKAVCWKMCIPTMILCMMEKQRDVSRKRM